MVLAALGKEKQSRIMFQATPDLYQSGPGVYMPDDEEIPH
jgi:hypothetical protein